MKYFLRLRGSNLLFIHNRQFEPLKERFNNSLKISKFTRTCLENLGGKSFSQKVKFSFLLISGDRCNRFFWDIRLKFYRLSNLNILFWFLLTTFHRTNKLFLCLQKVYHVTNYCKRRIQSNFIVNISLLIKNLLGWVALQRLS